MNTPLISIIIPCYNVDLYLPKCIESILEQTYYHWELILVDDGSKDKTPQVCDEYATKNSRIKVIHKENEGLVSSRNAGYSAAAGDWFFFLDADDWVDTDMLAKLVSQIEIHPDLDVIFWKVVNEINGRQITGKWEWEEKEHTKIYVGDSCKELAKKTLVYKYGIASPVIRLVNMNYARKYHITHDNRTKQGMEGIIFAMRSFYYAQKVMYVNEYFYHYRYNTTSISKTVNEKNTQYEIDCFKVLEEDIESYENKDEFKTLLFQKAAYVLLAIAMNTYFNPLNKESLTKRIKKFSDVINGYPLFKLAIKSVTTNDMDRQRKIAFWMVKHKFYIALDIIGKLKQIMLKFGFSNY